MPTRRQHRINELLYEELSLLVPAQAVDDPRVVDVHVTRVETTQDLSTAKVYVVAEGGDAEAEAALAALKDAEPALRGELARLGLRRLPHLVFARDRAFESGERVLDILDRLRGRPGPAPEPAPSPEPGSSSEPGASPESAPSPESPPSPAPGAAARGRSDADPPRDSPA